MINARKMKFTSVLTIQSYLFLSLNFSQNFFLYVLTVIYHEIISMFPYLDGRCAIFTKISVCCYVFSAVSMFRQKMPGKISERFWVFHCR
jgi:hypothetical protein